MSRLVRLRWWFFLGLAHETPRMTYLPPLSRMAKAFLDLSIAFSVALLPAFRRVAGGFALLGRAWGEAPDDVGPEVAS